MSDYAEKLQADLRTKLDRLNMLIHDPTWPVDEFFAELRSHIDSDAEESIMEIKSENFEVDKRLSKLNATRVEFIRILEELEQKTILRLKSQAPSSEAYSSLERRVDAFKDSSSELDDLDELYVQLALEIIAETNQLERRIFGEQTIIYWPLKDARDRLGSLVYFGDLFLSRQETDSLISKAFSDKETRYRCYNRKSAASPLLIRACKLFPLCKNNQVVQSFSREDLSSFAESCKFWYIGKSEAEYSGYSAHGSDVERQFVSYQLKDQFDQLKVARIVCTNASENLFDVYSSKTCKLFIWGLRLRDLVGSLIPTPIDRLVALNLASVHVESLNTDLLSKFTHLKELKLQVTFSKDVVFDLSFLGALKKLFTLKLTLPHSPSDLGVLKELTGLKYLKLKGASFVYAEKPPKLTKTVLRQILSAPNLTSLALSCFEIEAIDQESLSDCTQLENIKLKRNRIDRFDKDAFKRLRCPLTSLKMKHNDASRIIISPFARMTKMKCLSLVDTGIRFSSFAEMFNLVSLSLARNSIADLPRGVFDNLHILGSLDLSHNCIREIKRGLFSSLYDLYRLNLDGNPIEAIEAKALLSLRSLSNLSLNGCRLKSIDSEMFNNLNQLRQLNLNNNLIERIEVVDKDGRRINVAKASLNNEEREMVKNHLFSIWTSIALLMLSGNRLEKLDFNCFSNLRLLQELDLSSNKLSELSGEVGPELLSNLAKLYLQDNQLTTIGKNALPKRLFRLNLSRNKLESLDDDFFAGLTRLASTELSHNKLTWTITDSTLHSCSRSLTEIDLSNNVSILLTEKAFSQMSSLCSVFGDLTGPITSLAFLRGMRLSKSRPEVQQALEKLYSNQPQSSPQSVSSTNGQMDTAPIETARLLRECIPFASTLRVLDFSKNEIESLDDPDMFSLFDLFTIDLSGNRVSRIHRDFFIHLTSLSKIDLSDNNLSSIEPGVFRHLPNLTQLDLSSNRISLLNFSRLFRYCSNLRELKLADNQLDERSTAEPIDGGSDIYLKELVLANNRLERMDLVRDMPYLAHLNLRGNRIESVMSNNGENLLGRLSNLTHLDLSGNRIRTLRDEMFTHLRGQLSHLDISDNPLDFQLDSVLSELI